MYVSTWLWPCKIETCHRSNIYIKNWQHSIPTVHEHTKNLYLQNCLCKLIVRWRYKIYKSAIMGIQGLVVSVMKLHLYFMMLFLWRNVKKQTTFQIKSKLCEVQREDLCISGKILSKQILRIVWSIMWTGFTWFTTGSRGLIVNMAGPNDPSGYIEDNEFLG